MTVTGGRIEFIKENNVVSGGGTSPDPQPTEIVWLTNTISMETKNQREAMLQVQDGPTATFSDVYWLSEEARQAEFGLGARFYLCQTPIGRKMSEYTLQMGIYGKTRNGRYSRRNDSAKMDLSVNEWKMLLQTTPRMIEELTDLKKIEEERYTFFV